MSTWTSRVCAAALGCLVLAGCEDGFPVPGTPSDTLTAEALQIAPMSRGVVTLVAPQGFCIDPSSLRQRFALMARCDTLGARVPEDAPLALITVTTVIGTPGGTVSADALGAASETVLERSDADGVTLIRVQGTPPSPDLRDTYWRGATKIGGEVVGMALYEAQSGNALGPRAPRLLQQTLQRTQAQSAARADNSATPPDNIPRRGMFAGLFE
ncbi:hypothetical protein [Tateyamaria sp. SN6-1]|uniref:hypothetical protein n=1 Tax=Tateyamaria sp. SN6-1 TaxID=3092148 RepID=UPI0039F5B62E